MDSVVTRVTTSTKEASRLRTVAISAAFAVLAAACSSGDVAQESPPPIPAVTPTEAAVPTVTPRNPVEVVAEYDVGSEVDGDGDCWERLGIEADTVRFGQSDGT